jgi:hypothetical protein
MVALDTPLSAMASISAHLSILDLFSCVSHFPLKAAVKSEGLRADL